MKYRCLCACLGLGLLGALSAPTELRAEKFIIVVHGDMMNLKSYSVMTLSDFIATTKTIKIEGRLLAEAQKRAEQNWVDGGRYPGRVLEVRSVKRGLSYQKEADATKKLSSIMHREKDRIRERRKKLEDKLGRDEFERLVRARDMLKSELGSLVQEFENREKVGPLDL